MTTLQLQLREGRTADDVYRNTAHVNNYEPKIENVEETKLIGIAEDWEAPEGTSAIKFFTRQDGSIDVTYNIVTEIDNPETDIEFGKKIVQKTFAQQDAQLQANFTLKEALKAYEV